MDLPVAPAGVRPTAQYPVPGERLAADGARPGQDGGMRLDTGAARQRFAGARVARLATAGLDGQPHLVPFTFALDRHPGQEDRIYSAVDAKPKSTTDLRRLRNIRANPWVAVLADHYEDDWAPCGGCGPTGGPPSWTRTPRWPRPSTCWPRATPSTASTPPAAR